MLYCQQYNRVVLRFPQFLLDVTDGIAEIGNAVGQQEFELIGWHDYRADIDMAVLEAIADVDDVPGKEITSPRNLNLHAYSGYDGLIVPEPLNPIHITRLRLNPILIFTESIVNQFANAACTVRLFFVKNTNLCGNKDLQKLKKDV